MSWHPSKTQQTNKEPRKHEITRRKINQLKVTQNWHRYLNQKRRILKVIITVVHMLKSQIKTWKIQKKIANQTSGDEHYYIYDGKCTGWD